MWLPTGDVCQVSSLAPVEIFELLVLGSAGIKKKSCRMALNVIDAGFVQSPASLFVLDSLFPDVFHELLL